MQENRLVVAKVGGRRDGLGVLVAKKGGVGERWARSLG